jgi:ubiquinone/menaquinone biosynthesis C-methylase UbiE
MTPSAAAGYASARPHLHPEVFAHVREKLRLAARLKRALDVGCGTGLSSVALLDLAQEVVGVDASRDMLRHARRAVGVRYVASGAEALPFRDARPRSPASPAGTTMSSSAGTRGRPRATR